MIPQSNYIYEINLEGFVGEYLLVHRNHLTLIERFRSFVNSGVRLAYEPLVAPYDIDQSSLMTLIRVVVCELGIPITFISQQDANRGELKNGESVGLFLMSCMFKQNRELILKDNRLRQYFTSNLADQTPSSVELDKFLAAISLPGEGPAVCGFLFGDLDIYCAAERVFLMRAKTAGKDRLGRCTSSLSSSTRRPSHTRMANMVFVPPRVLLCKSPNCSLRVPRDVFSSQSCFASLSAPTVEELSVLLTDEISPLYLGEWVSKYLVNDIIRMIGNRHINLMIDVYQNFSAQANYDKANVRWELTQYWTRLERRLARQLEEHWSVVHSSPGRLIETLLRVLRAQPVLYSNVRGLIELNLVDFNCTSFTSRPSSPLAANVIQHLLYRTIAALPLTSSPSAVSSDATSPASAFRRDLVVAALRSRRTVTAEPYGWSSSDDSYPCVRILLSATEVKVYNSIEDIYRKTSGSVLWLPAFGPEDSPTGGSFVGGIILTPFPSDPPLICALDPVPRSLINNKLHYLTGLHDRVRKPLAEHLRVPVGSVLVLVVVRGDSKAPLNRVWKSVLRMRPIFQIMENSFRALLP